MIIPALNMTRAVLCLTVPLATLVGGCSHDLLGFRLEEPKFAAEIGFPDCDVTMPLSREEVLASSRRIGIEHLETSVEWADVLATSRPGDQLRLVNCVSSRKVRGARGGYSIYGLYRGDKKIREFGQVIND